MAVSRDSLLEARDWEQGVVPRGIKFEEELNRRQVTRDNLSEVEKSELREKREKEKEKEKENCWPSFVCFM